MAEEVWEPPARGPGVRRSTPMHYSDTNVVVDSRGQKWLYSEPADVWWLLDEGKDELFRYSARSYQCLIWEFGPVVLTFR